MATVPSVILDLSLKVVESWGSGPTRQQKLSNVLGPNTPLRVRMTNGTAAGRVDRVYFRRPSIGAGATLSIDLAGGLTDEEGNAITMARLKGIMVFNFDSDSTLTLRQPASNPVASLFAGGSGGGVLVPSARSADDPGFVAIHIPDGLAVTAGTGDLIELVNGDGSNAADCYLAVYGTSA